MKEIPQEIIDELPDQFTVNALKELLERKGIKLPRGFGNIQHYFADRGYGRTKNFIVKPHARKKPVSNVQPPFEFGPNIVDYKNRNAY